MPNYGEENKGEKEWAATEGALRKRVGFVAEEGKRRKRQREDVGWGSCTRWVSHDRRIERDTRWHGRISAEAGV